MMFYLIIAVVWVVCGVLAYGVSFAYEQKEYEDFAKKMERHDRGTAMIDSLFGTIALYGLLIEHGAKHGLMYRSRHRGDDPYE